MTNHNDGRGVNLTVTMVALVVALLAGGLIGKLALARGGPNRFVCRCICPTDGATAAAPRVAGRVAVPTHKNRPKRKPRLPKKRLDPQAVYHVPVTADQPRKGPRHAPVTIVAWSDFQCPYCKWAACVVRRIAKAYPKDVRIVFRHNPLRFHRDALPAAEAAMAAYAQRGHAGFWAMHDRLFPTAICGDSAPLPGVRQWLRGLPRPAPRLDRKRFLAAAKELGLDVKRFQKDLDGHAHRSRILDDQRLAVQLGARGTPAFFINGRYVRGVRPFARMKQLIDAELAKARRRMKRERIGLGRIYEAIIARGAKAPVYLKGGAAQGRIRRSRR